MHATLYVHVVGGLGVRPQGLRSVSCSAGVLITSVIVVYWIMDPIAITFPPIQRACHVSDVS